MQVELDSRADVCIVRLKGRFVTGGDATYLFAKCDEVTGPAGRNLIVDFSEVPYLDSTGVSFLVRLYTRTTNNGGKVVVAKLAQRVKDVLDLTRLTTLLPIFPDEDAALAALAHGE